MAGAGSGSLRPRSKAGAREEGGALGGAAQPSLCPPQHYNQSEQMNHISDILNVAFTIIFTLEMVPASCSRPGVSPGLGERRARVATGLTFPTEPPPTASSSRAAR